MFVRDALLSGCLYAALLYGLRKNEVQNNLLKILGLIVCLNIFTRLPYYFDDVPDTGDVALDRNAEGLVDGLVATGRFLLSIVIFLIAILVMAVSK